MSPLPDSLTCSSVRHMPVVSYGKRKIYILYLTSTHECVSRVRTHRDKYTNSQNTLAETRSPHTQCDIYSHCTVFFMQIVTISVQCFEICSRLQYISLCSCLCCVLPGASDAVRYIKKQTAYLILLSPPERKWMSPHWNWFSFIALE